MLCCCHVFARVPLLAIVHAVSYCRVLHGVSVARSIIENVPEAKDSGLDHLCEFIEDCEFPSLLVKILHLLGEQGPRCPHPRKYIRFVYNRLILENATVRAAAVSVLARFGCQVCVVVASGACRPQSVSEMHVLQVLPITHLVYSSV